MITLAQRIEELRTARNLSRPALSAALGFPKNAIEKFETGRQTPTQEQVKKMAAFFQVSLFYLRGESNDPTRQETWMDAAYADDTPDVPIRRAAPRPAPVQRPTGDAGSGSLFDSLFTSKSFQDMVRATVLDVLRSPEGQEILARTVRKELDSQR